MDFTNIQLKFDKVSTLVGHVVELLSNMGHVLYWIYLFDFETMHEKKGEIHNNSTNINKMNKFFSPQSTNHKQYTTI